jgi:hypothetical protein
LALPLLLVLTVHLGCAFAATVCFWTAALSPKGGNRHRAAGRWFAWLIYGAAATGAVLAVASLTDLSPAARTSRAADAAANRHTMWLVLYVLLTIVAPTQHGLAVVEAGRSPRRLRSGAHRLINGSAVAGSLLMLPAAIAWQEWLFLIVTPVGLIVGIRNLRYAAREAATRAAWEVEHLTSLLTAGVTVHTALLVFGSSRSLDLSLNGWLALVPWMLPAAVGVPAMVWFRARRLKRA